MTDMTSEGRGERAPRVLLLYYSYTGQSLKVLEAAGEVFRERGCDVHKAPDRVHRSAVCRAVLALPDATGMARHAQRAAGPEARCHRGDPNPGYGAQRRLRPDLHRLTDLVADREHADALLPEVG